MKRLKLWKRASWGNPRQTLWFLGKRNISEEHSPDINIPVAWAMKGIISFSRRSSPSECITHCFKVCGHLSSHNRETRPHRVNRPSTEKPLKSSRFPILQHTQKWTHLPVSIQKNFNLITATWKRTFLIALFPLRRAQRKSCLLTEY